MAAVNLGVRCSSLERIVAAVTRRDDVVRVSRCGPFIAKFTTAAASAGVAQFLDLGAGLPTSPSVHEAAQEVEPGARVVYVDNDPVVFTHGVALLPKVSGVVGIKADLTSPDEVLAAARETLDFDQPVGLIFAAMLHFFDVQTAGQIMHGYMDAAAPGSWLALSLMHVEDQAYFEAGQATYSVAKVYNHGAAEIMAWLGDWQLVDPGISEARRWMSGIGGTPAGRPRGYALCAVATKPGS